MDKTIEQVFKVFSHLGREIQIYVFSGLVIAINIVIVDYFYFNSSLLHFIQSNNLEIPSIVLIYLLGHFCMSFYYFVLEWKEFDMKIKSMLNFKYKIDLDALPIIHDKKPILYNYFIERYNALAMMRWTISAACTINFLIDIIIMIVFRDDFHCLFLVTLIIFIISSFTFYLLHLKTEKDYSEKIDQIKKI